jgi:nucleoside-diphosphate kinase
LEKTLILIKPDATARGLNGEILARFEKKGLKLVAMKYMKLSREMAERHYAVHKGKPFFNGLVDYITSGPIVAMLFSGDKAIDTCRKIMGATDPAKAEKGTIRADFGENIERNSVHGSDGPQTAETEMKLFFSGFEMFE